MNTVVDNVIVPVDFTLGLHLFESFKCSFDYMAVEGEDAAGPVGGKAEAFELVVDEAGVFLNEVVDVLVEGLAVEVEAGFALFSEMFFVDELGFKAGVVHAGLPEGGVALHAFEADDDVVYGVHGVAGVEGGVGVGWRHEDGVGLFVFGRFEGVGFFPESVDF